MYAWRSECLRIIERLLGSPQGPLESLLLWAVSLMTLVFVMRGAAVAVGLHMRSELRQVLALCVGLGTVIATFAAVEVAGLPGSECPRFAAVLLFGLPAFTLLALAIPCASRLLRARYMDTFLSLGSAVAATAVALMATRAVIDSVSVNRVDPTVLRGHRSEIEHVSGH